MSLFENLPKREDTYQSLMRNLDFYEKYLNSLEANGEEGVVEGLSAMLIGLGDISVRLLATMRTNLFSFYKSFKRSEIREYFEGHMVSVKRIEAIPFNTFMNVEIPAPAEMTARYMSAVEAVANLYGALDIVNTINAFNKVMVQVRKGVVRDEPNYGVDLAQLAQFNEIKMKKVNEAVAAHNANFAGKKGEKNERPFKDAYASMQEFRDVRSKLTEMEFHLQEVDGVLNTMQSANATLTQVANTLDKTKEVQADFIKQLVISVRNMASMLDIYGTACNAQMALEHNHVCVIETITDSLDSPAAKEAMESFWDKIKNVLHASGSSWYVAIVDGSSYNTCHDSKNGVEIYKRAADAFEQALVNSVMDVKDTAYGADFTMFVDHKSKKVALLCDKKAIKSVSPRKSKVKVTMLTLSDAEAKHAEDVTYGPFPPKNATRRAKVLYNIDPAKYFSRDEEYEFTVRLVSYNDLIAAEKNPDLAWR